MKHIPVTEFSALPVERNLQQFLLELLRELSGTLEDVIGREDSEGFVSVVGARMGQMMSREYCSLLETEKLSVEQLAAALVDLKARIDGGFTVQSVSDDEIVLVNTRCPFGEYVRGRQTLCMMTSNVFGRLAGDSQGYARVQIDKAFARGDDHCRVVISFAMNSGPQSHTSREYFG